MYVSDSKLPDIFEFHRYICVCICVHASVVMTCGHTRTQRHTHTHAGCNCCLCHKRFIHFPTDAQFSLSQIAYEECAGLDP